mmetsp:Transcript_45756/g.96023  ORF Transcript_45756/g.96023 Transcript_45756/m.96023 type:complete len:256 (-) Transcript_45756:140-907(-)
MGSHLNGPITRIGNRHLNQMRRRGLVRLGRIDLDRWQSGRNHHLSGSHRRHLILAILLFLRRPTLKHADVRHGQKAPLECQFQIPILPRYRVMHRQQLGTVRKRRLHLHLPHHARHAGEHLIPTEQLRPHGHEVRDRPLSLHRLLPIGRGHRGPRPVPDHLHHLHGDQGPGLGNVEGKSSREAVLGESSGVVEVEVVGFAGAEVERSSLALGGSSVGRGDGCDTGGGERTVDVDGTDGRAANAAAAADTAASANG